MAGNDTLAEIRLFPDVSLRAGKKGELRMKVPKDMPLGGYHLLSLDGASGKRTAIHDVLRVVMPTLKKPPFTMKDFERAMRKRGLDPASHQ